MNHFVRNKSTLFYIRYFKKKSLFFFLEKNVFSIKEINFSQRVCSEKKLLQLLINEFFRQFKVHFLFKHSIVRKVKVSEFLA